MGIAVRCGLREAPETQLAGAGRRLPRAAPTFCVPPNNHGFGHDWFLQCKCARPVPFPFPESSVLEHCRTLQNSTETSQDNRILSSEISEIELFRSQNSELSDLRILKSESGILRSQNSEISDFGILRSQNSEVQNPEGLRF